MKFRNITNKVLTCYGYSFDPDGPAVDVTDDALIRKFSLCWQLEKAEGERPETSREMLIAQAKAAGMKVDGRWNNTRIKEEMDKYMRGSSGD